VITVPKEPAFQSLWYAQHDGYRHWQLILKLLDMGMAQTTRALCGMMSDNIEVQAVLKNIAA
jgi:hypothetical protein